MIEVRIRMADEGKALRLCDWPVDRLDELLPGLGRWGISGTDGTTYSADELSAQIVVEETAAFFEVIVGDDG